MYKHKKNNFYIFAICFSYLVFILIFLFPIFDQNLPIFIDNLLHIAPTYTFFKNSILNDHLIPLWNPLILNGVPFNADPSHPIFNILNISYFLIPDIYWAITIQILILLWITCIGAFKLGKSLGLDNKAAYILGIFWGFSGSVFDSAAYDLNAFFSIALIPWVLYFFHQGLIKKLKLPVSLILVLAIQLLGGHQQYVYYEILLMIIYLLLTLLFKEKKINIIRRLNLFIIALFASILLAAVQVIPTFELSINSARQNNIEYKNIEGDMPQEILRYIFPVIYGKQNEGNSWGPGSQSESGLANTHGYVSIFALILVGIILINAIKENNKKNIIWLIIAVLIVLIGFGNNTSIYLLFYHLIPGFNFFRSPSRILTIYTILISVLASFSYYELAKSQQKNNMSRYILIFGLVVICFSYIASFNQDIIINFFNNLYFGVKKTSILYSNAYNQAKIKEISNLLFQSMNILGISMLSSYFLLKHLISKNFIFYILGIAFLLMELFLGTRGNFVFIKNNILHEDFASINYLKENTNNQKIISTGDIEDYTGIWVYFNHLRARHPFADSSVDKDENISWHRLSEELSMIPANINLQHELNAGGGYVAIMPKRYREYWNSNYVNQIDFATYSNPKFNDTGVKYFITGIPNDVIADDTSGRFVKVFEVDKIKIYENLSVKPRAQLLDLDNNQLAIGKINDINSQIIEIDIESSVSGKLVLRDFYYPGWIAWVDGIKQEIKPYDTLFRSLDLSSGKHLVRFEYKPLSFRIGAIISLISLSGLIIYLILNRFKYVSN